MSKSLYININNEQIQSNDNLEVLNYDLCSDFFFYLGEKIAKGCKVENENALITDFNTQDNAEDYQKIIAQWQELKAILFSEECKGVFDFTLPKGYIHWLKFHPQYVSVYDRNFSQGESAVITIDLEDLYEDSIEELQRKILRKLQRDDLYLEIDEVVFNDDAINRKSPIVRTIKEKYEGIGFKAYKKWLQETGETHTTPQVCEKCKKNPCECNTKSISSDSFFPYKGFTLGETSMNDFEDDLDDNGCIIHYDLDNGVTLFGATDGDTFSAAAVDSTLSSNNKLPKEWGNLLGCRFGTFSVKCLRALNERGFEIIFNEDYAIVAISPCEKYRVHLYFDSATTKFDAFLITLNKCPYCNSNNFALRKVDTDRSSYISYCIDCNELYLPFPIDESENDEEDLELPNCPNCSSDDVDDDGTDYLQYTCNDCGHNWGHDDTVECPECGSDDVENDGTDNLQYECNACGHMWGDCEDDDDFDDDNDDTDNAGNQMSEYYYALNIIVGKTTKSEILKEGGIYVKTKYGESADYYEMPNGSHVQLYEDSVCVVRFHKDTWNNIPYIYKNIGLFWGIDKANFRHIFEYLGFDVYEHDLIYITASKYCEKFKKSIYLEVTYIGGEMITFSIK